MMPASHAEAFKGRWYSDFVSPSGNIHYFAIELPDLADKQVNEARMTLLADRSATDKRIIPPVTYRCHVEVHGAFLAVLAKDAKTPSDGVNVMVLELKDDEMRGTLTWNSLTKRSITSAEIRWTRSASEAHRRATESNSLPNPLPV